MKEKIEKMIETDFQLQKLFMTENPEKIQFFDPESPKGDQRATRRKSASTSSRSTASPTPQQKQQLQQQQQQQQQQLALQSAQMSPSGT